MYCTPKACIFFLVLSILREREKKKGKKDQPLRLCLSAPPAHCVGGFLNHFEELSLQIVWSIVAVGWI